MKNTIRKLPTSKVAGLDGILNKAIKAALEAIAIPLANTATSCLLKSNLLEYCKDIITVVL